MQARQATIDLAEEIMNNPIELGLVSEVLRMQTIRDILVVTRVN